MSTTTTPDITPAAPILQPPPFPKRREEGLYGPAGWSVRVGMWPLLAQWPDPRRSVGLAPAGWCGPSLIDAGAGPVSDYVPFQGLDAATAQQLLEILPEPALADRQNLAPTLGAMLTACARADGQVRLSGYGIGPQRDDERLSAEALWVADTDLQDLRIHPEHRGECQCQELWSRIASRYRLDGLAMPDEILRTRPEWASGAQGWWLWWD
ncbi:hypothetical protein [Actinomyces bowdenii]|uniref:Uncharacterized protein n=1 Tax=Actinomyces bowdenii TaxID=131109 RepID=A0A853EFS4_9ACTO|nr:hypothetical protein [Actinomyces bowdenii]MBF0695976.1 hypothetical protein [Actinomyces bowdenii]NYS68149.1 hypothetical protein [Actinomyces bowdenii]